MDKRRKKAWYERQQLKKGKVKVFCESCERRLFIEKEVVEEAHINGEPVLCGACRQGTGRDDSMLIAWNLSFCPYQDGGMLPKGSPLPIHILAPLIDPL